VRIFAKNRHFVNFFFFFGFIPENSKSVREVATLTAWQMRVYYWWNCKGSQMIPEKKNKMYAVLIFLNI